MDAAGESSAAAHLYHCRCVAVKCTLYDCARCEQSDEAVAVVVRRPEPFVMPGGYRHRFLSVGMIECLP